MRKVTVSLSILWSLSVEGDTVKDPIDRIIGAIKNKIVISVIQKNTETVAFVCLNNALSENDIKQIILDAAKNEVGITDPDDALFINFSEHQGEVKEVDEAQVAKERAEEKSRKIEAVMKRIDALVAADEFKALAKECEAVCPALIKSDTVDTFLARSYVFAINDGNGCSTYVELFADLLEALGVVKFDSLRRVHEERVPYPQSSSQGNPFARLYSVVGGTSAPKVCCFDISEWMSKLNDKYFRDFLGFLDRRVGKNIIIFRVPFVEKDVLTDITQRISDRLFVKPVSFVPFDIDELRLYASDAMLKRGFTVEPAAWDTFVTRVNREKSDGRFYGINSINKIVREMLYFKQAENVANGVTDTHIKKSEITELVKGYTEDDGEGLETLRGLIGMEEIEKRVMEIIAQIETCAGNKELGSPCIHMRFVGNPGTGKTTVARVIGKILKEKGVLRHGNFFEHAGRDFCGRYIGETAPKTSEICRDAYGSVLFIDEAYTLYRGEAHGEKDFGREAIDTLIAEMENHRSDLVVIMAGYPDEMETLMHANAGLASRMPYIIEFPNYTREQLYEIYMLMASKHFEFDDDFRAAVKEFFEKLPDEIYLSKEFSNARFARNLYERTWGKAVLRMQLAKVHNNVLIKEDFLKASAEREFNNIMKKQKSTIGFF